MKLRPSISKKTWSVIASLLCLSVVFGIYFLVYVPSNVEQNKKRLIRILNTCTENVSLRFINGKERQRVVPSHKININELVEKVVTQNNNYFEHFIALDSSDIYYNSLSSSLSARALIDSLLSNDRLMLNNDILLELADERHLVFANEIKIDKLEDRVINAGMIAKGRENSNTKKESAPAGEVSLNKQFKKSILLVGLISHNKFMKSSRKVNPRIIINATIFLFILLLSLPYLKLVFISPIERLYRQNVLFMGVSLFFGTGFIILIATSFYSHYRAMSETKKELVKLTDSINMNFYEELKGEVELLYQADSIVAEVGNDENIEFPNGNSHLLIFRKNGCKDSMSVTRDILAEHVMMDPKGLAPSFNDILWIDTSGLIKMRIQTSAAKDPLIIDVSERDYFKKIKKEELWSIHENNNEIKPFALQSIKSWSDGMYEAAISIPHKTRVRDEQKISTAVLTKFMPSVMGPILLPGYKFCIIDAKGEVWFHSNIERNLQENVFEEIDKQDFLKSCIYGNIEATKMVEYHGEKHLAHISPTKNTSLYLVTLFDMAHLESSNMRTVTMTFIQFILLAGMFLVFFIALFFLSLKMSKLKKKQFFLKWLIPQKEKVDHYITISAIHFIVICFYLFLIWHQFYKSPTTSLILDQSTLPLFFILPIYLLAFTCIILNESYCRDDHLFRVLKRMEGRMRIFLWCLVIAILAFNVLFLCFSQQVFFTGLLSQLALLFLFVFVRRIDLSSIHNRFYRNKFYYLTFTMSWVLICPSLPILYFYKYNKAIEDNLWRKYTHLHIAKSYEEKEASLTNEFKRIFSRKDILLDSLNKTQASYIEQKVRTNYLPGFNIIPNQERDNSLIDKLDGGSSSPLIDSFIDRVLFEISPSFNSIMRNSSASLHPESGKYFWHWPSSKEQSKLQYLKRNGELLEVSSPVAVKTENGMLRVLFIVSLLLVLLAVTMIVYFSLQKIFCSKFEEIITAPASKGKLNFVNSFEFLSKKKINKYVFIISIDPEFADNFVDKGKDGIAGPSDVTTINFNSDPEEWLALIPEIPPGSSVGNERDREAHKVIISNFYSYSNNHDKWKKKYDVLEKLVKLKVGQIFIISKRHPRDVISFYDLLLTKNEENKSDAAIFTLSEEYHHMKSNWKNLFYKFIKIYEPITKIESIENNSCKDNALEKIIKSETSCSSYLSKLRPLLLEYFEPRVKPDREYNSFEDSPKQLEEAVVLKVQSLAEPFYFSLWASLSKAERYFIYDLAKDGFANSNNQIGMRGLLQKGLIYYGNGPRIMNSSFNNFILTVVNKETERQMQKELDREGNWGVIKIVLIIIAAGTLSFIFIGQEDLFGRINKLLGALLAVGGLLSQLTRFQSLTSMNGSK